MLKSVLEASITALCSFHFKVTWTCLVNSTPPNFYSEYTSTNKGGNAFAEMPLVLKLRAISLLPDINSNDWCIENELLGYLTAILDAFKHCPQQSKTNG